MAVTDHPNRADARSGDTAGSAIGYARVSRSDQNPALQLDALTSAGCSRTFVDEASGALDQRPALDRCLDHLRPGDVLTVWRLDRLGRSLKHLLATIESLEARGIGFKSLTEGLNTTSASGRLMFSLIGALAEFERDLIRERTRAGLAAARARGRKGGRPCAMSEDQIRLAREMYDSHEYTVAAIGAVFGVDRSTIYRSLRRKPAQPSLEMSRR